MKVLFTADEINDEVGLFVYPCQDCAAQLPLEQKTDTCPDCGGRGVIAYQGQGKYECSKCEGNGQV